MSHSRGLSPAARWGGTPKVAPELLPWPVGVLVVAPMGWCWGGVVPESSMGWCSKSWGGAPKNCPRIPMARWGGVPKVGVVFQKVVPESSMEWCSKGWGGVPKSCPRIPMARWGGVPKVGVVFQKVVPESPLCILLVCIGKVKTECGDRNNSKEYLDMDVSDPKNINQIKRNANESNL